MGQAKQRGTFEQRQRESIEREAARIEREQRRESERVALAKRPASAPGLQVRRRASHNAFGRTLMLAAVMAASMGVSRIESPNPPEAL